jgi:hypothetical protein
MDYDDFCAIATAPKLAPTRIGTSSATISSAQQDPWLMAKVNRDAD